MKFFVNIFRFSLYLIIILMLMSNVYKCDQDGDDDSDSDDDCDDCAELILKELTSGEDDVAGTRSTRTRTRVYKSRRKSANNNKSERAKREIQEAIATLKKYAQWKGKWDFIKSAQEVIRESKDFLKDNNPSVLEYNESEHSTTCGNLTWVGVKIITDAIQSKDDHESIASEISQQMNIKYGKYWHVIVSDGTHSAHNIHHDSYLIVKVGELHVIIFHSSSVTTFDAILDARKKTKNKKEASISKKSMPSSMSDDVIENAIDVVKQTDDLSNISRAIISQVSNKYKDHDWQAIIGPKREKCYSFDIKHDLVLQFALDDVEITLFSCRIRTAREMIIKARTATPKETKSSMDPSMKKEIIQDAVDAIKKFDEQSTIADFISEALNMKYGKHWFTILSFGSLDIGLDRKSMKKVLKGDEINDDNMIEFTIGEIKLHIYKMFRGTNEEEVITQAKASYPKILNNQMPSSMKTDALLVAVQAFRTSSYLLSIASKIQNHFEKKYASEWQVIVNLRNNDVHANLRSQPRSFLHFIIGEIVVRIFRVTSSDSSSIACNSTQVPSKSSEISESKLSTNSLKQLTQEEAIRQAKSVTPEITKINNLEEFETHAMDMVEKALSKRKTFEEIASDIRKNFAENFEIQNLFNHGFNWLPDMYWNCLVGFKDQYSIGHFLVSQQRSMTIDVKNIRVIIFQMGGFQCDEMLVESRGGKVTQRPHWISGDDVTSDMYKKVQKISNDLMKTTNSCTALTEKLTEKLQQEWSGYEVTVSVGVSNSFQHSCEDNTMRFYIGYISFKICL